MRARVFVACMIPWVSPALLAIAIWLPMAPSRIGWAAVASASLQTILPVVCGLTAGFLVLLKRQTWAVLGSSLVAYSITAVLGGAVTQSLSLTDFVMAAFLALLTAGLCYVVVGFRGRE